MPKNHYNYVRRWRYLSPIILFFTLFVGPALLAGLFPDRFGGQPTADQETADQSDNTANILTIKVATMVNPNYPSLDAQEWEQALTTAAGLLWAHYQLRVKFAAPEKIDPSDVVRFLEVNKSTLLSRQSYSAREVPGIFRQTVARILRHKKERGGSIDLEQDPEVTPILAHKGDVFAMSAALAKHALDQEQIWYSVMASYHSSVPDSNLHRYRFWLLFGQTSPMPVNLVVTNQIVTGIEYNIEKLEIALRGGYTNSLTIANSATGQRSFSLVSNFALLSDHPNVVAMRKGEVYSRDEVVALSGMLIAYEVAARLRGRSEATETKPCLLGRALALDYRRWSEGLNATACQADPDKIGRWRGVTRH